LEQEIALPFAANKATGFDEQEEPRANWTGFDAFCPYFAAAAVAAVLDLRKASRELLPRQVLID
jgi:hypothetical protein